MRKILIPATTALAALFALGTIAVDAASAKPGARGMGGGGAAFGQGNRGFSGSPPGFNQGMKSGWQGANQPPGWSRSRGKKRGWDRGGTTGSRPPGLR